ncbi:fatty acid desaturase, partial [Klebsiella pneumoniae]
TAVEVDDPPRSRLRQLARRWRWRSERPPGRLSVTGYGGWLAGVAGGRTRGLCPAPLLLLWLTAWDLSCQHELIQGHPPRLAW